MSEADTLNIQAVLSPREYTKQHDQEGRDQLAQEIASLRSEYFQLQKEKEDQIKEIEEKLKPLYQKINDAYDKKLEITQRKLKRKVSTWNTVSMALVRRDFVLERIDKEEQTLEAEIERLHSETYPLNRDKRALEEQLKDKSKLAEAVKKRAEYYETADEYTLTKEQIKGLFTEETLSGLTTEQLMRLWSKGHPYFVSHVTRHGFRDHNAMMYHSGGMGRFADGFRASLSDERRLQSPFYIRDLKDLDVDSIREWMEKLEIFKQPTKEKAQALLHDILHHTIASAPHFPDKTAVHFAVESVLNAYYGGETGNEVFFIFPTDLIASQSAFAFNGFERTFKKPQSEAKWNDLFVWFSDRNGLGLDAGLVFIPSDMQVDPRTGSKYASEEVIKDGVVTLEMVQDPDALTKLKSWLVTHLPDLSKRWQEVEQIKKYDENQRARDTFHRDVVGRLQTLGLTEEEGWARLDGILRFFYSKIDVSDPSALDPELLDGVVDTLGIQNKKPETTVSAEEFWEAYFQQHPEQRPKHVVYYTGSPTVAVRDFLQQHGVRKVKNSPDDELLDFGENHVQDMEKDPRSNVGYDEIMSKAAALINEAFPTVEIRHFEANEKEFAPVENPVPEVIEAGSTRLHEYLAFEDVPLLQVQDIPEEGGLLDVSSDKTEQFFLNMLENVIVEIDVMEPNPKALAKLINNGKLDYYYGYTGYDLIVKTLKRMVRFYPNMMLYRGTDFSPGTGFRGLDFSPNMEQAIGFAIGHRERKEPVLAMVKIKDVVEHLDKQVHRVIDGQDITSAAAHIRTEGNWWRHSFETYIDDEVADKIVTVRRLPDDRSEIQDVIQKYRDTAIPSDDMS